MAKKLPDTDGIPVYCAMDKIADITLVTPNPRNPNTHPHSQIELLAKIIRGQGWRQPITISARSGLVVKGHGRLMAAQMLGLTKVPVDVQEYASDAEEYADMIADNKLAELAEVDKKALLDLIEELDTGDIDLDFTGYSDDEIQKLIEEMTEEWDKKLPPPEPLAIVVKDGDVWKLGVNRIVVSEDKTRLTALENEKDLLVSSKKSLIACDKTGRRFFLLEPDAEMVEAIIRRWEKGSRRKAVKISG